MIFFLWFIIGFLVGYIIETMTRIRKFEEIFYYLCKDSCHIEVTRENGEIKVIDLVREDL